MSERIADIPDLAKQFCREASQVYYRYGIHFADKALSRLQEWDWSNGNVSALKGCVGKLVGAADGPTIEVSHVEKILKTGSYKPAFTSKRTIRIPELTKDGIDLAQVEKETEIALLTPIIEDALRICRGVKSRAASLLVLSSDQLSERIKKCGVDAKAFRS